MNAFEQVAELIESRNGQPETHQLQWAVTFMDESITCKEFVAIAVELGFHATTSKMQYYKTKKENREIDALCEG